MATLLECKIVEDLLPGYIDGITSDETNAAVEDHLKFCEHCSKTLEAMKTPVKPVHSTEKFTNFLKKIKHKSVLIGAGITAAALTIIISAVYFLTIPCLLPVPAKDIIIKQNLLTSEKIDFSITELFEYRSSGTEMEYFDIGTNEIELRIVIKRPILCVSKKSDQTHSADFSTDLQEKTNERTLTKIYYGDGNEEKIIWQK